MNKKGFVMDAIPIIATVFGVAILCIVALSFFSALSDGLNQNTDPVTERGRSIATSVNTDIDWVLDFILAMLLIALPVGSMILAFFNNIPPFFFFASLGVILLIVVFGAALAEGWENSNKDNNFFTQSQRMPITDFIMINYAMYSLFVITIILGGTYIKIRNMV